MKWTQIFCVFSLVFLSGCGLLWNWGEDDNQIVEPQLTPGSDLSLHEGLMSQVHNLIFRADDCVFPCFGGLVPCESSTEAIEDFMEQLEADESMMQLRPYEDSGFGMSIFFEPAGLFSINLQAQDEKLDSITLGISNAHEWLPQIPYNLPEVFTIYDEPDDVYVLVSGPPIGFALVMPYNERGFMFRYTAFYDDTELASNNEPLPICLNQEIVDLQQVDIWLQSPNEAEVIEINQPDLHDDREIRPWWNIQRMANVTVTEFADFFVSHPQECLLIPSLAELREQGYVP